MIYTVIFAFDIFQVRAFLALAEVAAKCVHTLSVVGAQVLASNTFINIYTCPLVLSQLQARRWTETVDLPLYFLTAILTVSQRACPGICTRSIRHHGVSIEAVALVTAVCVHAPMFTWTRFQPALI